MLSSVGCAGGDKAGALWHRGLSADADIVAHYANSLANVLGLDGGPLEKALLAMDQARNEYTTTEATFIEALGEDMVKEARPEHVAGVLERGEKYAQRAAITRQEALMCQALQRSASSKTKERLLGFAATLTNELPEGVTWRSVVHEAIVDLVDAIIK